MDSSFVRIKRCKYTLAFTLSIICACSILSIAQDLLWESYMKKGMGAFQRGDYIEAERMSLAALKELSHIEKQDKKSIDRFKTTLDLLSNTLLAERKYADAEPVMKKLLELVELTTEESEPDLAVVLNNIGLALTEQRKFKEAETVLRRSLSLRERYLGKSHPHVAVSLTNLGKVYYDQGKIDEAFALFSQGFQILIEIPEKEADLEQAKTAIDLCNNLGLIYTARKEYQVAEKMFQMCIEAAVKLKGSDHPDLTRYYNNYAKLLRLTQRPSEATQFEARAQSLSPSKTCFENGRKVPCL